MQILHHSLYSQEDLSSQRCCTAYCKCLNVRIDFIDQSFHPDRMDPEYQSLETALDAQSGINCTLFFRAFLLSIHVRYRWLVGCTLIYNEECPDEPPQSLYQCHCCSYTVLLSTEHILGKCIINHQLQNVDKEVLSHRLDYSTLFHLHLPAASGHDQAEALDAAERELSPDHPLNALADSLRHAQEEAMRQRIEDFRRNEERKFEAFCHDLDREYAILAEPATLRQRAVDDLLESDEPFDFKMHSLLKMERDLHRLMEENLKINFGELHQFMHSDSDATASSMSMDRHRESGGDPPWALLNHDHEVVLKLPLNEQGEMVSGRHSMHSLSTNTSTPRGSPLKWSRARPREHTPPPTALDKGDRLSDPPTPRRDSINESHSDSESRPMEHGTAQSVDTLHIHDDSERDDDDDLVFAMDDEDEDDEDRSFMDTPESSVYALDAGSKLKGIPELHINIMPSADTMRSQSSISAEVIHEDSETDDRVLGVDPSSRSRRNAKSGLHGQGQNMLSPLKSSQFGMKIKSSGSLRIKSPFESKSVLSRTLNVHSALVSLNKRRFEQQHGTKGHHEATQSDSLGVKGPAAAKTFNPPKQMLDALKLDDNKRKTKGRAASNAGKGPPLKPAMNGTLTVGTHTFSGIWAKSMQSHAALSGVGGGHFDEEQRNGNAGTEPVAAADDKEDEESSRSGSGGRLTVHHLFETKQSLQSSGHYAYSFYSRGSIDHEQQQ